MGCVHNKSQITKSYLISKNIYLDRKSPQKYINKIVNISKVSRISSSSWEHVVHYLKYAEVKELGKTSKFFNVMCKKHKILVKFFKKKINSNYQNMSRTLPIEKISTFSAQQNLTSFYYTSNDEA